MKPDHDRIIFELLDLAEATDGTAAAMADATIGARLRQIAIEVRDMARDDTGSRGRDWPHPFGDADLPGRRLLA